MSVANQHEKPVSSMMCLCTMEDITEEDGNYVEYQCYPSMEWKPAQFELSVVQQVCACIHFILFCDHSSSLSLFAPLFSRFVTNYFSSLLYKKLLDSQFETYLDRVKKTNCQAELRRLLAAGPPIYLSDKHGLPLDDECDEYVINLWYACDGKERSAKLKGALEGVEREELSQSLKRFIIVEGKEAIDDERLEDTTT